jgi:hypothetical protein
VPHPMTRIETVQGISAAVREMFRLIVPCP